MTSFTLDTNCMIAVVNGEPEAASVMALTQAHIDGKADVAVAAVSASERQPGDTYLDSYEVFRTRLAELGMDRLGEVHGLAYADLSYWDHALYSSDELQAREERIHRALFPNIPFLWRDFATAAAIPLDGVKSAEAKRWRNAWCDRQMFWAHHNAGRDVFVTSDRNFAKLLAVPEFAGSRIMSPSDAVQLI